MRVFTLTTLLFVSNFCFSQDSLSMIFIGDIMGHDPQIETAFDSNANSYDYTPVFEKIAPVMSDADVTIANLEVTLAGPPFKGYPKFSSPDALASACKNSGIDVLVTANNHSVDRGGEGIIRTINVLDSLGIRHTGTFKDSLDRDTNNLLIIQKGEISVGVLNYTYGTNGQTPPSWSMCNMIDSILIAKDLSYAQKQNLDKIIVVMHWGKEYENQPNKYQTDYTEFLFNHGADVVIGSHPHVLQKMEYFSDTTGLDKLVVYSLGNFVSNQRTVPRDGGAMVQFELIKTKEKTTINNPGYILTWVNKPKINGVGHFEILPVKAYENGQGSGITDSYRLKLERYAKGARELLNKYNHQFPER